MGWSDVRKYLLAKAQEVLPMLWGPTALATYPLWEDHLLKALQENLSQLWLLRLLILLLAICLFLGTWLFLKRTKFIEYRGAFFKRKSGGGLHQAVYCGTCKNSTTTVSGEPYTNEPFICKCGWRSSFLLKEFNDFYPNLKS